LRSLIVLLLVQADGLRLLLADLHAHPVARRRDGHLLVAKLPHHVKRLLYGLLARQPQGVRRYRRLDRLAHLHRRSKIPIRRHQTLQSLMRPLEIVSVDIEPEPPLAVLQIGKHRPRQALLPQRLPETLDLSQRLRMLRPRLEVPHSLPAQLLLEGRRSAPSRVLPSVVGQHFLRDPVLRNRVLESVEHEKRLLLPLQGPPDQEP
jgi:hypothetical protein